MTIVDARMTSLGVPYLLGKLPAVLPFACLANQHGEVGFDALTASRL
jgi:hypothetical protein